MEKICKECGKTFRPESTRQEHCEKCRKKLKCCADGCEDFVRYPTLQLCSRHYIEVNKLYVFTYIRVCSNTYKS